MNGLIGALRSAFGERLIYVGLQGSYLRGEATETSDIDPMVVIDQLSPKDLDAYRAIIDQLPDPANSCGFLCGRQELACWNALEMSHLLHCTRDLYGTLADLIPAYDERDIRSFIQLSIGNLYHELCHRYVHSSSERTGVFCATRQELLARLEGPDLAVMKLCAELPKAETYDFASAFETLFGWCRQTLASL